MKTSFLLVSLSASSLFALALAQGCSSSSSGNKGGPQDAGGDHTASSSGSASSSGGTSSSGSSSGSASSSGGSSSGSEGGATPAPPALGTQIDREGRPAINTALTGTFDPNCTKATCPAKDAYNANSNPTTWGGDYATGFAGYLGIYDSLDTVCGNQPGYAAPASPASYGTLASVLANDVLWVNTGNTTCQQYLGVEFAVLGVANTDCGGRTPAENVIDVTYNVVAGTLTPATLPGNPGIATNGITAPASPPTATFPYLASPH